MNWYKKIARRGEHWTDDNDSVYNHFFGDYASSGDRVAEDDERYQQKKTDNRLYDLRRKHEFRKQRIEKKIVELNEELKNIQEEDYAPGSVFKEKKIKKQIDSLQREKYKILYP